MHLAAPFARHATGGERLKTVNTETDPARRRCDYLDPALAWTGVKNSGRGISLSKFGKFTLLKKSKSNSNLTPYAFTSSLLPEKNIDGPLIYL